MIVIYQFFLALVLAIAGPFLLLRKKTRAGILQKLGFVPESIKNKSSELEGCIWIHAVSVGEFNAVYPLAKKFSQEYPDTPLVISTTTATGQAIAKDKASDIATIFYFPFDLPFAMKPWLDTLAPTCAIIVETEIWPGFVKECSARDINVLSVNARISPNSFNWYYKFRYFFGPVLKMFTRVGVQNQGEFERFTKVGAPEERTEILGNIKLDGLGPVQTEELNELREKLGLNKDDFVIVAGSTHEGEEEAVIKLAKYLSKEEDSNRPIKLIIAPRHPERFERAANIISDSGFSLKRFSKDESLKDKDSVYLLDALGQLTKFYGLASLAFVGGTIAPVGGHNVAEPYANAVPVCCGPNIQKTKDVALELKNCGALLLANDVEELCSKASQIYKDNDLRIGIGDKGAKWLNENQGACQRAFNMVNSVLAGQTK